MPTVHAVAPSISSQVDSQWGFGEGVASSVPSLSDRVDSQWQQGVEAQVAVPDLSVDTTQDTPNTWVRLDSNPILPETDAPYLASQSPAPSEVGVGQNDKIEFDVLDEKSGVTLSTLFVYVEGVLAYRGDTDIFSTTYDLGSTITPVTGSPSGYSLVIGKQSSWTSYGVITVRVVAEDSLGNVLDTTYWFRSEDYVRPTIDTPFPSNATTDVDKDSLISFSTHDEGSSVDPAKINCTVNGTDAIINGVFQVGWDGAASLITANGTKGFDVTIEKVASMGSYEVHTIIATCDDNDGNSSNPLQWWFRTEDWLGPLITPIDPTNGQSGVPVTSHVTVNVTDDQLVNSGSIRVEIDVGFGFVLAYEQGGSPEFKPGYDGPDSGITAIAGGYQIIVDLVMDFPLATAVSVRMTAADPEGNPERL